MRWNFDGFLAQILECRHFIDEWHEHMETRSQCGVVFSEALHNQRSACGHDTNGREQLNNNGQEYSRSEEHTSELQSRGHLVCRLLLEKKKNNTAARHNQNIRC